MQAADPELYNRYAEEIAEMINGFKGIKILPAGDNRKELFVVVKNEEKISAQYGI